MGVILETNSVLSEETKNKLTHAVCGLYADVVLIGNVEIGVELSRIARELKVPMPVARKVLEEICAL